MKENKNIERLFQEKFKDFEALPPEGSWNRIASRIEEKKKKRRVIPFWFKASGIAASLFIGLFLILNYDSKSTTINKTKEAKKVVIEKDIKNKEIENSKIKNEEIFLNKNIEVVENDVKSHFEKDPSSTENTIVKKNKLIHNSKNNIYNKKESSYVSSNNINKKTPLGKEEKSTLVVMEPENSVDFVEDKNESQAISLNKLNTTITNNEVVLLNKNKLENGYTTKNNKEIVRSVFNENNLVGTNALEVEKKQLVIQTESSDVDSKNKLDYNSTDLQNNLNETKVLESETGNSRNISSKEKLEITAVALLDKEKNTEKKTIKNEKTNPLLSIEKLNNGIQDSTIVITEVETEVNALEQLLKEKEEGKNADEKEKEKRSKWVVSSNAAPVYFNSISNGSPIDEQFTSNEKSYAQTLSYGLGLQYAITKKISIRSGINAININYNTNNIYYSSTLGEVNSSSLNIAKNGNAQNLILRSSPSTQAASLLSSDVENLVDSNVANLNQEMGYIEVPLELSYKILDKKFGIEFIGGMSTLFLNKNTVSLVSRGSEMNIGEANNLNDIHFSSNVGLGFNYNFWKAFHLNFQPVFKYQINTFNSNSGNFKPYIIGLYSGVSFNF